MNTTYTRLTLTDREEISRGMGAKERFSAIARRLGRPTSAVSREVWLNVQYSFTYRGERAQDRAVEAKHGRPKKLDTNERLREYVYQKLTIEWSPEEIAQRIKLEYPEDKGMRISHETIYQHLYCLPKGELKKELVRGLRQKRKLRQHRANTHYRRERIPHATSIADRPEEVADRVIPGHWEGDLVVGLGHKSAIGTLVERTTRLTLIVKLKTKDAEGVRIAFAKAFRRVPNTLSKTLTYDRGSEMSEHLRFTEDTNIKVYFADPQSPWQRGTNENTNGLIRQYFPKGTDFSQISLAEIRKAERRLNERPRKVLDYYTPSEKFYELITGRKIALGA